MSSMTSASHSSGFSESDLRSNTCSPSHTPSSTAPHAQPQVEGSGSTTSCVENSGRNPAGQLGASASGVLIRNIGPLHASGAGGRQRPCASAQTFGAEASLSDPESSTDAVVPPGSAVADTPP